MSDLQRTIEIIFQGTDSISSTLTSMSGKVDKFGNDLQDIGQPFADATTLVLALDAAIAGLAVAGITASSNIETATAKMTASLGLTNDEAEKFKGIAENVYTAGFGEDLAGAFDAVTLAQQKLGDNAAVDIGKVTTQALELQKTFGTDINDSLGAVKTLMSQFGLTSTEAMDFVADGFQKGLDGSGDFLESINEYSTQFANGGADAGQFFSVMESGFSEGMLGTDKAADAFKEFRVRIQDGSTTTKEALESIGIDSAAFEANLASGKMTAIEAFDIVQQKLNETGDVSTQFNAGVGLMGTQFEDLGTKTALGLSSTKTSLSDLSGTMDSVAKASETFEKTMTSAFRTVTNEFGNMDQWEDAKAAIGEVFADVAAALGPAMEGVDFTGLEAAVGEVWDKIAAIFVDNDFDLTSVEGMENAIQTVADTLESLATVTGGIVDIFTPMLEGVIDLTTWFNSLDEGSKTLVGNILGLGTGLTALGGILSVGGSLLGGLGTLVGFFSPAGVLITGLAAVATFIANDYNNSMNDIAEITARTAKETEEFKESLEGLPEETKAKISAELDAGNFEEANRLIGEITEEEWEASILAEIDTTGLPEEISDVLAHIPTETEIAVKAAIDAGDWEEVERLLAETEETKEIDIKAVTNIEQAMEEISWFDEDGKEHTILVNAESSDIDKVKKDIEALPSEKLLEIKLQGDIDKDLATIETQAETIQTAMEWTAKVDIAEIEAAATQISSAFEAASDTVASTSEAVASMFGSLSSSIGDMATGDKWYMQDVLDDQMDMEQQALDIQKELTAAQVAYMQAKTESINNGDGLIKIDGTGLSPALEMVMWEILELVQVRANEESADFLLGLGV